MNKKKGDDNFFMDFLKKDGQGLENVLKATGAIDGAGNEMAEERVLPRLETKDQAEATEVAAYWRNLRAFFRTAKGGGLPMKQSDKLLPANMARYRNANYVENEYPVWMEGDLAQDSDLSLPSFDSVSHLIDEACKSLEGYEEEAGLLKANRYSLEKIQREIVLQKNEMISLQQLMEQSFPEFLRQLKLDSEHGEKFEKFLANLLKKLSLAGNVIEFSEDVTVELMAAALHSHQNRNRVSMQAEVRYLITRLRDLLEIEKLNQPEANRADELKGSMDFVEPFIDFKDLASVMPSSSAQKMPEDRLHRIERVLSTLESVDEIFWNKDAILVLEEGTEKIESKRWGRLMPGADLNFVPAGQLCNTAIDRFEKLMGLMAQMFRAIRVAQLELEDNYYTESHEDFFTHFDWHLFSAGEIAVCPPVILVSNEETLLRDELNHFSYMLATSRPIHTLALKKDAGSGYVGLKEGDQIIVPQELGSFAVSHRNTYVLQSTPVSPANLYKGFWEGLQRHVPCVYHILVHQKGTEDTFDDYLWTSAAVESREYPGFVYDSFIGSRWGSRFNISANPAAEEDWPLHEVAFQNGEGEETSMVTAFTFADFAAQDPAFKDSFLPVPPSYWTEDLVPVQDYLQLASDESYGKVPFIWMVGPDWKLERVAVAWKIILACKERLDYWDYLQENAGIHNVHAEATAERVRAELEAEFSKEREELQFRLESEKAQAVEEAAGKAMKRLASFLLDMGEIPDLGTGKAVSAKAAAVEVKNGSAGIGIQEEKVVEEVEEEEEISMGGEAWIETALCTSCNECTDLNKKIFNYNGSKQAFIADPKAGPFRDIVEAAEMCPASIIHPGAPQHPDEEGLEELIQRAEPFN